jgi:hypothetical protein
MPQGFVAQILLIRIFFPKQHLYLELSVIMLLAIDQYGRSSATFLRGLVTLAIGPEAEFRTRLILLRS